MVLTAVSVSTLLTFVLLPLGVFLVLALSLLPCLFAPGAKLSSAMKALYCYIMQCIGISMMTAGALPAVYGVLEKFSMGAERFSAEMYLSLLILFSCGGVTFLWHEQTAERIDDASRRVPALLFWYSFKSIGYVLTMIAGLSFLFTMLLIRPLAGTWWITPIVVLLYGLLLSWCTRWPQTSSSFKSIEVNSHKHVGKAKKK